MATSAGTSHSVSDQSKKLTQRLGEIKMKIKSYEIVERPLLDASIVGIGKALCPKYKMDDLSGEVTPSPKMVHISPELHSLEIEEVLEDDGKVYNIRAVLLGEHGLYLTRPFIEYSDPLTDSSSAIKTELAKELISAWENFCSYVQQRVSFINGLRRMTYRHAKRPRVETHVPLANMLEPGNDIYKVVVEAKSDVGEEETVLEYPNKRLRLMRTHAESVAYKRLQIEMEASHRKVKNLVAYQHELVAKREQDAATIAELIRAKISGQETCSQLLVATEKLSDADQKVEDLTIKLDKSVYEKGLLVAQLERTQSEKRACQERLLAIVKDLDQIKEESAVFDA